MLAAAVAVAGLAAACTSAERQIDIDGGTPDVVVLGDVTVGVRPGQKLIVRNAGGSIHALVGPSSKLPPLFAPQAGGLVPNPKVWGPQHSGRAGWDGRSYWSTGAIQPGQLEQIPLTEGVADATLSCAFHPALRVVLRVGGHEGPARRDPRAAAEKTAQDLPDDEAQGRNLIVAAGLEIDGTYAAAFLPKNVRIPVGGAVTWRAGARAPIDVVFGAQPSLSRTVPPDGVPIGNNDAWDGAGVLRSGFLSADRKAGAVAREWTVRFMKPGTYRYASRFGEAMTGTVVVEP